MRIFNLILFLILIFLFVSSAFSQENEFNFEDEKDKNITNDIIKVKNENFEFDKKKLHINGQLSIFSYATITSEKSEYQLFQTFIALDVKYTLTKDIFIFFSPKFLYEFNSSGETNSVELNEAWVNFHFSIFDLSVGHKKFSWGKVDEINPTDIINYQDYSDFLIFFKKDRKKSVFSFDLKTQLSDLISLNTILIPYFKGNISQNEIWFSNKSIDNLNYINNNSNLIFSTDSIQEPEQKVKNSSFALELAATFSPFDFSFYYYNGYNKNSNLNSQNLSTLYYEYKRIQMFGFDFAFSLGDFTIRGESAFYPKQYFDSDVTEQILDDYDGHLEKPFLQYVVGFDIDLVWAYTNIQFYHNKVFEYNEIIQKLENEYGIVANIYFCPKKDDRDSLKIGSRFVFLIHDNSFLIRPFMSWQIVDNLQFETFFLILYGTDSSTYGQFKDNSSVGVNLKSFF